MTEPVYRQTYLQGLLKEKISQAYLRMDPCQLCPRKCGAKRLAGEAGVCRTGATAGVVSFAPHFGEEPPLVGTQGSGTIFFSGCNLMCLFCQNDEISHQGHGQQTTPETLADIMLSLERMGCHNINFVTPTHVVPQILAAVEIAAANGLSLPLIYNSGGYDCVETLRLLDGVIDIYMPDFKFWDPEPANLTCDAPDYPEVAKKAIREMFAQAGNLTVDSQGIATRGLLVRHLVMPEGLAGTESIVQFLKNEISPNTHVNIMSQYRPCGTAHTIKTLSRPVSPEEFRAAVTFAKQQGLILVS